MNYPQLSIVIPAYNEEDNIPRLYTELVEVLEKSTAWEVILVDDGSTDSTWQKITTLNQQDGRIRGLRFSRNFGHQYALFAGLSHARGQAVITMDADLQHPPQLITKLIVEWEKGNKVVNAIRLDPDDFSVAKRITSRIFYKMFSFLSGVHLQKGMADFRLLDRQVVHHILQFGEEGLFLRGIIQWVGFPNSQIAFHCNNRFSGHSKYTLRKMLRFGITGITSFSIVPLRLGIIVGIITSIIAFYHLAYAVYAKLILEATVPGWATTISILSFMFGILFILIGLVGEYIGRILIEVRSRPRFIISEQLGFYSDAQYGSQSLNFNDSKLPFYEKDVM